MRTVRTAIVVVGLPFLVGGCGRRMTGDSTQPAFATVPARVDWMTRRLGGRPPSAIRDAHFFANEIARRGGVEGLGYTSYYFWAKIVIDPADAPKWSAATRPGKPPRGNPWDAPRKYAMTPAELAAATWYEPEPLFGPTGRGGRMAITRAGDAVFVFQVE